MNQEQNNSLNQQRSADGPVRNASESDPLTMPAVSAEQPGDGGNVGTSRPASAGAADSQAQAAPASTGPASSGVQQAPRAAADGARPSSGTPRPANNRTGSRASGADAPRPAGNRAGGRPSSRTGGSNRGSATPGARFGVASGAVKLPSNPDAIPRPGSRKSNAAGDGDGSTSPKPRKPRKQNFVTRQVNHWCNRLLGAVTDRQLSGQEEYASHRTSRDYVWNSIGTGAWGMVFPVLTVVVTQLVGTEQAGMFSMAFVTGMLLMYLANYGVRTYQVSDLDEAHSFADYQVNRWITCALMVVVGVVYCNIRGYGADMFTICMGVYIYKMIDGLADVYEGRLQQADKMYLAGISLAFRSVAVLILFSVVLLVSGSLPAACVAMAIVAGLTFIVFTFPLAMMETPKSRHPDMSSVIELFKRCFPLFLALFLYQLIDNMPKFVMEGVLSYDNQLYYNVLYFPAMGILMTIGVIYKPLLVRMAEAWTDPARRKRFDLTIVVIILGIAALTGVTALVMNWIGVPIFSFLYGVDFEQFRGLMLIMIAAGGVTASIDFLYQVITVLRRQKSVMRLYIITFGFSLFVPVLLVNFTGLPGAVIGYLIVMCILLVLLVTEYVSIRLDLRQKLTGIPSKDNEMPTAAGSNSAALKAMAANGGAGARKAADADSSANDAKRASVHPRSERSRTRK